MVPAHLPRLALLAPLLLSCGGPPPADTDTPSPSPSPMTDTATATVEAVRTTGEPGRYQFSVTLASPDTGCGQYANWWEVITPEGELLYRRILIHSHVDEQPFTRSGGPVNIAADQPVIVRGHMDPGGYGPQAQQGSVATGFEPTELEPGFAAELAQADPQPQGCEY